MTRSQGKCIIKIRLIAKSRMADYRLSLKKVWGMKQQAYIKDGKLRVHFNQSDASSLIFDSFGAPLGNSIADFSALPEDFFRWTLERLRDIYLEAINNRGTREAVFVALKNEALESAQISLFFNIYLDAFVMFLVCLPHKKEAMQKLRDFLLEQGQNTGKERIQYADFTNASAWAVEVFTEDFIKRQTQLKEDLEFISGNNDDYTGLTPMQRLYMLSKQGRNYLSGEFKTVLSPDHIFLPGKDDAENVKSTLLQNKVDIVEMVEINSLDDLLRFELFHTLKAELPLRKCKHCGEFFIVRGRVDTEYCDRPKLDGSKPCSIIGATRNYWDSKADDPVHIEFQKAYKRNHSRQRVGKMTQTEFYEWSEEARKKRGECEAGTLSLEEFVEWLERGRVRRSRGNSVLDNHGHSQ